MIRIYILYLTTSFVYCNAKCVTGYTFVHMCTIFVRNVSIGWPKKTENPLIIFPNKIKIKKIYVSKVISV